MLVPRTEELIDELAGTVANYYTDVNNQGCSRPPSRSLSALRVIK